MKQIIKLTETQLKNVIAESVKKILKEGFEDKSYQEELQKMSNFLKNVDFDYFHNIYPQYDVSFADYLYIQNDYIGYLPSNEKQLYNDYICYIKSLHEYNDLVLNGEIDPEEYDFDDWFGGECMDD